MKKRVTLLAAVLLFLVVCTGCGNTDREAGRDSSGGNQIEQDGKLLDKKIQLLLGKMIAGVGSQKDVMHGEGGNILLQQGLCV